MSHMTNQEELKSLTNVIMMDASRASEIIPNLDAIFSFVPYKFYTDGPAPDKAQLFSCMLFGHDGIKRRNPPATFYAGQMTKEDIVVFMDVFKINGRLNGVMQALQLFLPQFLQKYSTFAIVWLLRC
jgi:hypothetical protein